VGNAAAKVNALVGAVIDDRYEVGASIGAGAMGHVYRARQRTLDRDVALKVLSERHAKDPELVGRFKREAKAASAIGHPGIVQVFDFGRLPDGRAFLVMELIEGKSLGDILAEEGHLPVARAVGIARQVCDVLTAAHERHIVHRDLKPDNLLVMEGDRIKLIDFGIAKLLDVSLVLTKTNTMVGTPLYMAPEQWQGDDIDGRTDLYALGSMIFEMIAGRPPFETDHLHTIITKHLTETPPTLRSLVPSVPSAISELVARCLAKRLEDRPRSAQALSEGLEQGIGQSIGYAATQATPQPMPQYMGGPAPAPDPVGPQVQAPTPQPAAGPLRGPLAQTELYEGRRVAAPKSRLPWVFGGAFALLLVSGAMVYTALSLLTGTVDDSPSTTPTPQPIVIPPPAPAPVTPTLDPLEAAAPETVEGDVPERPDDAPTSTVGGMAPSPRAPEPAAEPERPHPAAPASLLLESEPTGARVSEGGMVVGRTPYEATVTRARRVTVSADGYEPRTVQLRPGEPSIHVTLRRAEPVVIGSMRPAMADPPPDHSSRTRGWDD